MKLLVMGAGYVGMALLNYLQCRPYELYITTTQKDRMDELKAFGKQVCLLDTLREIEFQELIQACDGMVILVAPKNSKNYEATYLSTAKRIAFALEGRQTPFYLLYTSSTSVCEGYSNWVSENMTLAPTSLNAKILLETEQIYVNCRVNTCILRLGGIYGPQRELADRARRFSGNELPGSGNESTNHIHLDDIVAAIGFCLDHSLTGIYHLVNDDHRTRRELYGIFCQSQGIPDPIWNSGLTQGIKGSYKVSNQKIKNAGFQFKHPQII